MKSLCVRSVDLMVEDNPGDVRRTQDALKEAKVSNTLHVVEDGVAALDFLYRRGEYDKAPRPRFDLLDLNLPRKNGRIAGSSAMHG
jgi:two-component system, chemotaxis family, response regulator Rcp1